MHIVHTSFHLEHTHIFQSRLKQRRKKLIKKKFLEKTLFLCWESYIEGGDE